MVQQSFGGINQNIKIGDNEFKAMKNMTSEFYPVLSPRTKRKSKQVVDTGTVNDVLMIGDDMYDTIQTVNPQEGQIQYVLRKNTSAVRAKAKGSGDYVWVTFDEPQQMFQMGANIILIPSKTVLNTESFEYEQLNIYEEYIQEINDDSHQSNFNDYQNIIYASTEDGKTLIECTVEMSRDYATNTDINTSTRLGYNDAGLGAIPVTRDKDNLQRYINAGRQHTPKYLSIEQDSIAVETYDKNNALYMIDDNYVTIRLLGINRLDIVAGDYINLETYISGQKAENSNVFESDLDKKVFELIGKEILVKEVVYSGPYTYIIVKNKSLWSMTIEKTAEVNSDNTIKYPFLPLYRTGAQSGECKVVISRKMPDMEYMTVSNNRLWGCSSENHEIYASKLGDPKRWRQYSGISTDSYAVTIGSPGRFTGGATFNGTPVFFKENLAIAIYGSKPSNYQTQEITTPGVEEGSDRSIATVNGYIYYKSRDGIRRFNGGTSVLVSPQLTKRYKNAVGGACKSKYYVSMEDDGNKTLLVLDTDKNMWHAEDDIDVTKIFEHNTNLFGVVGNKLVQLADNSEENSNLRMFDSEEDFEWYAVTNDLYLEIHEKKYINKMSIRAYGDIGAKLQVLASYDDNKFELLKEAKITDKNAKIINVIPRRCDHMKLMFKGTGQVMVDSITKSVAVGSEV